MYYQNVKLNVHTAYLNNFFFYMNLSVIHNTCNYVEINGKQIYKVDIKLINIFTIILLIRFFVCQWYLPHLRGSRVVYIMKSVFFLISNHIFVYINHKDTFYSDNKWCAQRFIKFMDENSNLIVIKGNVISLHKEINMWKEEKKNSMVSVQNIHCVNL